MKRFAAILLLWLHLTLCCGQVKTIVGVVTDGESAEPVAGAIVQAVGSKVYTFTDSDGCFSLNVEARQIRVQSMGYRSVEADVVDSPMHIKMKPEATQLRDVIIKAPDIIQKSDTLVYPMSKWAQAQDRNLADVLRRLPGVEVEKDGSIMYNGEPINKFYIDGSDFVNDRYGVATNNISPDDVASVEIMENHQPVKVLQGLEFSQRAGLNIKLKDDARSRWIAILNAGIGADPLLYDVSLFAMRIAKKWQNMETMRVNDTGWNPTSQSQRHTDDNIFGCGYQDNVWPGYISIGSASAPLAEQRTRDNLSFLAQSNNSRHIADGFDIRLDATCQTDRLAFNHRNETRYLAQSIPSFVEQNILRNSQQQMNGQWTLQLNRESGYVKDNLYVDVLWDRTTSDVNGTQTLHQQSDCPSIDITNDLKIVKRIDDHLLTVSSRNRYSHRPLSLSAGNLQQDLTTCDFRSVTEGRYGFILHRWQLYTCGGIDLNLHHHQSSLYGLVFPDYPLSGDKRFLIFKAHFSPEANYQHRRWWVYLSLPFCYWYYGINDHQTNIRIKKHYPSISPVVDVSHQLTAKTDLSARLCYSIQPVLPSDYTQTVIMSDFRNLIYESPSSEKERECSAMLRFRYRNPVTSLFANISAKYEQNHLPLMLSQQFYGNRILTANVVRDNNVRVSQVNGGISKGLFSAKFTVGLDAFIAHSSASMMRQEMEMPYTSTTYTLASKIMAKPFRWFSADYRLSFSNSRFHPTGTLASTNKQIRQDLAVTFLSDQWQVLFSAEHYHSRFPDSETAGIVFLDFSFRWILSKSIDLSLTATNLLNETEYRYSVFGSLSESVCSFKIRPRNILIKMQIKL